MSRTIIYTPDGGISEAILHYDQCQFRVDDVCCNDRCERRCDFVGEEDCENCPEFEKEDGIIDDGTP